MRGNKGPKGMKFAPKSNGGVSDMAKTLEVGQSVTLNRSRAAHLQNYLRLLGRKGSRRATDGQFTVTRIS